LDELLEHEAAVAVNRHVDAAISPELGAVEIDLHDLAALGPGRRAPVVDAKIEGRPEDEDDVGLRERELARARKERGMLVGDRAARHSVQEKGRAERVGRAFDRVARRRPADLRADQETRALGLRQELGGARDRLGIARRARRMLERARRRQIGVVVEVHEEIERHLEEDRARHVRLRDPERGVDVLGHPTHLRHLHAPLGDRAHEGDRIHVLKRPHVAQELRARAADDDHRDPRALRVRDRGDDVGDAGTGGDRAHAGPAGDARVAVGGVTGGLLVANVDDLDLLVEASVVDGLDVAAAEREKVRRSVALERLRDEPASVHVCHAAHHTPSAPARVTRTER
jgi:hypothetical protein